MTSDVQQLIKLLRSDTDRAQIDAAAQLGRIGDEAAVAALTEMFFGKTYGLTQGDGSPGQYERIIQAAAAALGQIGSLSAIETLLSALHEKHDRIGLVAAQDVDRFFRDVTMIQTNIFLDACKRKNVRVMTPSVVYDFNHPMMGAYYLKMSPSSSPSPRVEWGPGGEVLARARFSASSRRRISSSSCKMSCGHP
jgi:hypothetical protein